MRNRASVTINNIGVAFATGAHLCGSVPNGRQVKLDHRHVGILVRRHREAHARIRVIAKINRPEIHLATTPFDKLRRRGEIAAAVDIDWCAARDHHALAATGVNQLHTGDVPVVTQHTVKRLGAVQQELWWITRFGRALHRHITNALQHTLAHRALDAGNRGLNKLFNAIDHRHRLLGLKFHRDAFDVLVRGKEFDSGNADKYRAYH